MGGTINQTIIDDYGFYEEIFLGNKLLADSQIELDEFKPNHKKTRTKSVDVTHWKINEKIKLTIESNKTNNQDFKFKLFCLNKYNHPFFRFDSDGVAHKNNDPGIPLEEQQVTTPHFHFFNKKGIEIAYKTDQLKNIGDTTALLEDINLAISHFCSQSNLSLPNGDFPVIIQIPVSELPIISNNEDPMRNVSFD